MMDIARPPTKKRGRYAWMAIGALGLVGGVVFLGGLDPAAPVVDRSSIWTDTVRFGELVLQVRGPGTLVPERSVVVAARAGGTIERVLVENGMSVTATTVLVQLLNPEVEQQALDAERQLAEIESQALIRQIADEQQRLTVEAALADVRSAHLEAQRQASIDQELLASGIISPAAAERSLEREADALRRLTLEENRYRLTIQTMEAQRLVDESAARRQRETAEIQRARLNDLRITAGIDGIVQGIALDIGQNVSAGQVIARVTEPDRLKAVLRVSEVQARDVAVGLRAEIDTRSGIVSGVVSRVDPASQDGSVGLDVALEGPLPRGARPDLNVDGLIEIERLDEVLRLGRPVFAAADQTVGLFRLEPDGQTATLVQVQVGRISANAIQIASGLSQGDVVILSDMGQWAGAGRVRLR